MLLSKINYGKITKNFQLDSIVKLLWLIIFCSLSVLAIAAGMSSTEKPLEKTEPPPAKPRVVIPPGPSVLCNIREFERIALTTHDAEKRRKLAYRWVEEHGPNCRQSDLMYIYNNSATLLGTANHPELRELIYFMFYSKE
jgi:hypothetical protein